MCQSSVELRLGLILIMTDEAPMREGVVEIMEMAGLLALATPHGPAGITLYQERMADVRLVLLDLPRPSLSDEEMLNTLWRVNPSARVILSSSYSPSEVVRRFPAQKLAGYLQKPYGADELLDVVRQHIGVPEPTH